MPGHVLTPYVDATLRGKVSTNNTTSTLLGNGGVFTGVGDPIVDWASIIISVKADQASATDGLEFQFSPDNANWFTSDYYTIAANVCKTFTLQPVGPYFRVKYTNGVVAQGFFYLCTQYRQTSVKASSHRMGDDISGQDDAELTKAILAAERPGIAGIYTNIQATNGGNLKVSIEEVEPTVEIGINDSGNSITVDGTVTANQGTAAVTANRWPVQLTDGTDLAQVVQGSTPTTGWNEYGIRAIIGPTDIISNIPVMMPYDHHQIHEGEAWQYQTSSTGINNGVNVDLRLQVPNITLAGALSSYVLACPHLRVIVQTLSKARYYLYEGSTWTVAGAAATPVNHERNGTYTPKLTPYTGATVNALGTLVTQGYIPAGGVGAGAGGSASQETEFVLKNNTEYLFRVTSLANGNEILVTYEWYEDLGV